MSTISYREYLELVERYHQSSATVVKSLLSLGLVVVVVFTLSVFLSVNSNQKIQPSLDAANYFDNAKTSFFKTRQSMGDLVSSFQVAGEKTVQVDKLNQSTSSATPGFFITLGDTQNLISQVKSTKENITFERDTLKQLSPPEVYLTLNSQLIEYHNQTEQFLNDVQKTQEEVKDLLLAAGPNFYLPAMSDEGVWQSQNADKIKAYYENKKKNAQDAQNSFKSIKTSDKLVDYKAAQLSYFQLVINVSDNILTTLNKPVPADVNSDQPTNIEEAYQALTGAQKENELIAQKLSDEKLKLTSTQEIRDKVSLLNQRAKIIESALADGNKIQEVNTTQAQNSTLFKRINLSNIF